VHQLITSAKVFAKWIVGNVTVKDLTKIRDDIAATTFGTGRDVASRSTWESIIRAMRRVSLVDVLESGALFVTYPGQNWRKEAGKLAVCLTAERQILVNLLAVAEVTTRPTGKYCIEAEALDENAQSDWASSLAVAFGASKIRIVAPNMYGADLPCHASGGIILLFESQCLIDKSPIELLQLSMKQDTRVDGAMHKRLMGVLSANDEMAAFLGRQQTDWRLSQAYCKGAKQCAWVDADTGEKCSLIDHLSRQQPCERHLQCGLEKVTCKARALIGFNKQTRQSFVIPIDRHSAHGDLPIEKVPKVVEQRLRYMSATDPLLKASTALKISFPDLNRGEPVDLVLVAPALINVDRLEATLKRGREKDYGMGAAVVKVNKLSEEDKLPFIRKCVLAPAIETAQVVIAFTDNMYDNLQHGTQQVEGDLTFETTSKKTGEITWDLYNMVTIRNGEVEPVVYAFINGRKRKNYFLLYKTLFEAWDEQTSEKNQTLLELDAFLMDFEAQEINGLRDACIEALGVVLGEKRFRSLLRLCIVHWKRIVKKHSHKVAILTRLLFETIGYRAAETKDVDQCRECIELLCTDGSINRTQLLDIGISPREVDHLFGVGNDVILVNWSNRTRWVNGLLKEKSQHIIEALARDGPGSRTTNHVESVQSANGLREFKAMPANSNRKAVGAVLKKLFESSKSASRLADRKQSGARTGYRSADKIESRKNDKLERADAKRQARHKKKQKPVADNKKKRELDVAEASSASTLAPAGATKKKKVKGEDRETCMCTKGNCDDLRCSCFKKYGADHVLTCGVACSCRCAEKRTAGEPAPPIVDRTSKKIIRKALKKPSLSSTSIASPSGAVSVGALTVSAAAASASDPLHLEEVDDDFALGEDDFDFWEFMSAGLDTGGRPSDLAGISDSSSQSKRQEMEPGKCAVCLDEKYEAIGGKAMIQCLLTTPTKRCCSKYFHVDHATPKPNDQQKNGDALWHCESCKMSMGMPTNSNTTKRQRTKK
jgi:hypothetical protein